MICPKCGAEFRHGFTTCSDCDVGLIESTELAAGGRSNSSHNVPRPGDPNKDPFCSFWKGTDLRVCTEICTVLDEAAIPHKILRRQDRLFNLTNQAPYEVGVPASLYERAEQAIKEGFGVDEESGENAIELLPPAKEDPRAKSLRSVWVGDSAQECAALCRELGDANIEYKVDEQREVVVRGTVDRYQIGVGEEDYERAAEITGGFHPEYLEPQDEEEQSSDDEIPEPTYDGKRGTDWVEGGSRIKREEWYPEDATSLIWQGEAETWRPALEMSLQELDIPMRWESGNGLERVYVPPEDAARAKAIVQEVVTGEPANGEG